VNILAIDLGKTGCRVQRSDGSRHWRGESSGAVGMAHPEGPASAMAAIERALSAGAVPDQGLDAVCLGAAGVASAPAAAQQVAQLLADRFAATALVASDSVTSHAGALAGDAGVVLAVGTGSVAITFDATGALVQVDGWGQTLGDEGSGWWIGREGLMAACRALDGRGPHTTLRRRAEQAFGDLRALPRKVGDAAAAVPTLASFAPQVLAAAAEDGDEPAAQVLSRAQDALGASVAAAADRAGSPVDSSSPGGQSTEKAVRCCVIGGLAKWPEHFRAGVRQHAAERAVVDLQWAEPAGTSLDGAALIASRPGLPHHRVSARAVPRNTGAGPV